jgi:hypothetical protein
MAEAWYEIAIAQRSDDRRQEGDARRDGIDPWMNVFGQN